MQSGKAIRLNRILPGDGKKALIVAFDHGFTVGPIPGTENPLEKVRTFVDAKVDGVLLTPGAFTRGHLSLLRRGGPGGRDGGDG